MGDQSIHAEFLAELQKISFVKLANVGKPQEVLAAEETLNRHAKMKDLAMSEQIKAHAKAQADERVSQQRMMVKQRDQAMKTQGAPINARLQAARSQGPQAMQQVQRLINPPQGSPQVFSQRRF